MEDNQQTGPDGVLYAPSRYVIHLHPADRRELVDRQPDIEIKLAQHVVEMADMAGLSLYKPPAVHLEDDETIERRSIVVGCGGITEQEGDTGATLEMQPALAEQQRACSPLPHGSPFLVLQGRRHVNLLKPVVALGRALDNDVIVEDPRVSRRHAQLRRRYNRYVLYDLGSRGGTRINGYPVEECVLHSGDVISLAGVELIYGEDPSTELPSPGSADTPALAGDTGEVLR
jgi:hypothetical protein